MYRGSSIMLCSYGRALLGARTTALAYRARVGMCTRGYATGEEATEAAVEKKEKTQRVKQPKDSNRFYLNREFNVEQTDPNTPTISLAELKKLMQSGEKYVLIDLRTDKEIELAGDPALPTSVKMPISPITHLNSYKPPKVKVDPKKTKGKSAKAAKLAKAAASKAQAPPKEDLTQRDLFRPSFRMTPTTWQQTYNFPKIEPNDNVIFYSSSNVRSSSVVNSAMKLGYTNVKVLDGGSRVWNKYYNITGTQSQ